MSKIRNDHRSCLPKNQRFLAEETTDTQVRTRHLMLPGSKRRKAKAEGWPECQEQERAAWEKAREKFRQEQEREAAALVPDRYRASVQWAQSGIHRTTPRLVAAT